MKAELIRCGWVLEKTHDLERLLGFLAARDNDLAPRFEPLCDSLADVYFSNRYPGFDFEDPDWLSLQKNICAAGELLGLVKARIANSTAAPPGAAAGFNLQAGAVHAQP
jgi:HEPN domain-containing protein